MLEIPKNGDILYAVYKDHMEVLEVNYVRVLEEFEKSDPIILGVIDRITSKQSVHFMKNPKNCAWVSFNDGIITYSEQLAVDVLKGNLESSEYGE